MPALLTRASIPSTTKGLLASFSPKACTGSRIGSQSSSQSASTLVDDTEGRKKTPLTATAASSLTSSFTTSTLPSFSFSAASAFSCSALSGLRAVATIRIEGELARRAFE